MPRPGKRIGRIVPTARATPRRTRRSPSLDARTRDQEHQSRRVGLGMSAQQPGRPAAAKRRANAGNCLCVTRPGVHIGHGRAAPSAGASWRGCLLEQCVQCVYHLVAAFTPVPTLKLLSATTWCLYALIHDRFFLAISGHGNSRIREHAILCGGSITLGVCSGVGFWSGQGPILSIQTQKCILTIG